MRIRDAFVALVAFCACPGLAGAQAPAVAVFDLAVTKSDVMKTGTSRIVAKTAYVRLAHGLSPGNSDALEILFFATPPTEAARADFLNNDARESRKGSYAAMVLFVDKQNKVWQVNLSYVVPGTTIARTVAWKRDDLKKYFSDVRFDGMQLVLKSNGDYSDSEPAGESVRLAWQVDVDLPVIRGVKR